MGDDPSQHPPDWWNISSPCWSRSLRSMSAAAGVWSTLLIVPPCPWGPGVRGPTGCRSEEPELLARVGHQQVLGLLVVVEHHLVVLAADARALVAAERRRGGVGVVAVRPHPPGLDVAARAVGDRRLAGPHAGAQPVEGVVGGV